jgi:hypothetical protein
MTITLDGTLGITTPSETNTGTLSVTGVTTLTGGLNAALPVLSGGTGVTTSTGTGAVVLGTSPTITGATITVAATAAPAFSAYQSALNQTLTTNTLTKISFNTEEFDTNSNYDSATNFRFTPTVAGYYQVTMNVAFTTGQGATETVVYVYKNGSPFKLTADALASAYFYGGTALIYLNGSTDYIEAYAVTANAGTKVIANNSVYCYFQAFLARSA